jgi:hypothetical protein
VGAGVTALTAAVASVRALAAPHRLRVVKDAEGYPVIPGRLGQVEFHDGRELAVHTDRPRLFARLWAIPGVRRWQTGDTEMRALFPPEALLAVAAVIRARRRRAAASAAHLQKPPTPRYSVTSAA